MKTCAMQSSEGHMTTVATAVSMPFSWSWSVNLHTWLSSWQVGERDFCFLGLNAGETKSKRSIDHEVILMMQARNLVFHADSAACQH